MQPSTVVVDKLIKGGEKGFNITFHVVVVIDICLEQAHLIRRQEHTSQRAGVIQHQRETRLAPFLGLPGTAVPKAYSITHVTWRPEKLLQQGNSGLRSLVPDLPRCNCHSAPLSLSACP